MALGALGWFGVRISDAFGDLTEYSPYTFVVEAVNVARLVTDPLCAPGCTYVWVEPLSQGTARAIVSFEVRWTR